LEEQLKAKEAKPVKLAIGGEGGFNSQQPDFNLEKEYALVVIPARLRIPLPNPELPELVLTAVAAIIVSLDPRIPL
jgi:ubiquitin carboxyl-terminal hydrolase 5/13